MTDDIEELLDGTVDEVKDELDDFDGDLSTVLAAEKAGKDRKTLTPYIERLMEERSEQDMADVKAEVRDALGTPSTHPQYEDVLDGTVDEVKARLDGFSGDLHALMEAEARGKDRETVKEEIADRIEPTPHSMEGVKGRIATRLQQEHDRANHDLDDERFVRTGIPGFDDLFDDGIPRGSPVLLAGGAGAGKTIFGLQTMAYHAAQGENCFYMSFEESEEQLKQHMRDFGWDADALLESGNLKIKRYSPFEVTRQIEAMLAEEKGELMIDIEPLLLPEDFTPEYVVIDSLTAISSAFSGEQSSYRIYIEQLFRFFEEMNATTFLITETRQEPEVFSPTGAEEFLADGVIVLYNMKRLNVRQNAVEVLKMRGASHAKKLVALQITDDGIRVYPDQEVFS